MRDCLGREYGGAFCSGENVEFSRCYDIDGCTGENTGTRVPMIPMVALLFNFSKSS